VSGLKLAVSQAMIDIKVVGNVQASGTEQKETSLS
jgi:hypothetical protein